MIFVYRVTEQGGQRLPTLAQTVAEALNCATPAVYTAFRTYDHDSFLALDRHLTRLSQSAQNIGLPTPIDPEAIRRSLRTACADWPHADARVRIDVQQDQILIALSPLDLPPEQHYQTGITTRSVPEAQRRHPHSKYSAWIQERSAFEQPGIAEHLLLSPEGNFLEGFTANLFLVCDDCVWTAPTGVLAGITRGLMIEIFSEMGIPVLQQAFPYAQRHRLQEAAISSAIRELLPVVRIDDQAIGDGRPGPICIKARQAYQARVQSLLSGP